MTRQERLELLVPSCVLALVGALIWVAWQHEPPARPAPPPATPVVIYVIVTATPPAVMMSPVQPTRTPRPSIYLNPWPEKVPTRATPTE